VDSLHEVKAPTKEKRAAVVAYLFKSEGVRLPDIMLQDYASLSEYFTMNDLV